MFQLKWLSGLMRSVAYTEYETIEEVLNREKLLADNVKTHLFFKGANIPLSLTFMGAGIEKNSVVIIHQKVVDDIEPDQRQNTKKIDCVPRDPQRLNAFKRKVMKSVCNKSVDHFYNSLELQTKKYILFNQVYQSCTQKELQKEDEEEQKTITDYETKISTEPLPFFCGCSNKHHCHCNVDQESFFDTSYRVSKKADTGNHNV